MTMLMRTDPFRDIDRMFEQLVGTTSRPAVMHVDAERDGDWFNVYFDLPGVDPDSIDLTVEQNVLTVRAQREAVDAAGDIELIVSECPAGTFTRQVFLGETLDTAQIQADYSAGVLKLSIPIREAAKPRRVAITSSDEPGQIGA
jgi:HSP20 family protein